MTIIEKRSRRKKEAIITLVNSGEYSVGYALILTEQLNDDGKFTEEDYEELAEYLENLLNPVEETPEEEIQEDNSDIEEIPEENSENSEEIEE